MEWSRAKNIILIVLILANGFLAMNIVSVFLQTSSSDKEMKTLAISLLRTEGHTVADDALAHLPRVVYGYFQERDAAREDEIARLALGTYKKEERGGGIAEYMAEGGRFSFRNGGAFIGELNGVDAGENLIEAAETILKTTKIYTGRLAEKDGKILGVQKIDGNYEIEDFALEIEQNTKGIRISGRYFDEKNALKVKSDWDLSRLIVELSQVIGTGREIRAIELVYICESSTAEGSLFVPALKVELDTETVYLNGNTGVRINS